MVSADNKADLASGPLVIDRSHVMGRQVAPDFRLACSRLMALLTSEEKRRGLILTLSILFNGWLNILGISILVPFIYLVVSEDPLDGENLIARALRFLNFRDEAAAIFWVGIAILLLSVVKNAYGLFHRRAIDLFCANVELRLTSECVKLIAQAPYSWFSARNTTVLRELALGHVAEFTRSVLRMLLQLGSDLAILGFSVAFVLIVNPVAGLIVTVSVAFVGVALVWACRSRVFKGAEEKRLHARSTGDRTTHRYKHERQPDDSGRRLTRAGSCRASP